MRRKTLTQAEREESPGTDFGPENYTNQELITLGLHEKEPHVRELARRFDAQLTLLRKRGYFGDGESAQQPKPTKGSKSAVDVGAIRNPEAQIKAWISGSYWQWQFLAGVVHDGAWDDLGKTKEQAENLVGYYEGQYDMAMKFRDFMAQKTRIF